MTTGFYWDECTFWHGGGNYALTLPVGGLVQPGGGLPENPETKRRLLNLMRVTGMDRHLSMRQADPATRAELERIHPARYLDHFKEMSDAGGGEIGLRTPFGPGGYEIAALSAGLTTAAIRAVAKGDLANAYALSRPPGHHCLPDWPNGFCLLANIAIGVEAARAAGLLKRVAILDWDVHHGNGTEAIYLDDPNTLTISLHQERNYPLDTGDADVRGPAGTNLNIPLPPGTGHTGYLSAMERLVLPTIRGFAPDLIVVACGFDASAFDVLSRMLATAETFRMMTSQTRKLAEDICGGRLVLAHEGGYSEVYVPFCGHASLEALSEGSPEAPDPMATTLAKRQPGPRFDRMVDDCLTDIAQTVGMA